MAKRKPELSEPHRANLLDEMGLVRTRLKHFQDHLIPFKEDYVASADVNSAIDKLAEHLTKNKEYYHAKNHCI